MSISKDYTASVRVTPESLAIIEGELPWEKFSDYERQAFDRLAAHLEVDGFRKGKVPEAIARKQLPDELILSDMAELAIQALYPKILEDEHIDAIGRPELALTKLARGNALGFSITTAVLPEIALPDYKTLARAHASEAIEAVTDADVEKVIEDLRQMRAYGHVHGPENDHAHDEPLPEVTDEFAASFGVGTVAEMRAKVRENLLAERTADAKDKRRIAIMEAITAQTSFPVPALVIRSEQEKMLAQIEADVARAGLTLEDYLNHAQKTKEALLEEYKPEAEKRARFQMTINAIARAASLAPSDDAVEEEAKRLVATYPGADLSRARAYADMALTNEAVLSMLENA